MHEYAQFASIIKKLLAFRHQKHAQVELTQDALEHKRASLEDLERNEREASRLEEALGRGRATGPYASTETSNGVSGHPSENTTRTSSEETEHAEPPLSPQRTGEYASSEPVYTPPHPVVSPPPRRSGSGMGLLNALSYTLHGMMDVDTETARRNSISKTRESISQVSWYSLIQNSHIRPPVARFSVLRARLC